MQLALSFNFWKNGLEATCKKHTVSTYSNKIHKIFSQVPEEERILLLFFKKKLFSIFFVPYTTPSLSCCLYILFYSAMYKKDIVLKNKMWNIKLLPDLFYDIFIYIQFFFFIILRNQRNKPLKENLKKIAFYSNMEKK